jgi:hypothetical protein
MHKKAALIVLACLFAFTANGEEKVQWIDATTRLSSGKRLDDINKDRHKERICGYLCGLHGKSYAGEFRCKDNRVEVNANDGIQPTSGAVVPY